MYNLLIYRVSADGRILDMYTTHPSLHFYTGYALSVPKGKNGATYGRCSAMCLFPNAYPDSPNKVALEVRKHIITLCQLGFYTV